MDRLPRRGTASSLSRIRAATLRPVVRASCLNRRSVVSGSFTVIPFIITYHGNPILTERQYRALGLLGRSLLDWIGTQPDLEASRVMVTGASYGGNVALVTAMKYPERIRCAIDIYGPSNLVTFLERTGSYRQDLRRLTNTAID